MEPPLLGGFFVLQPKIILQRQSVINDTIMRALIFLLVPLVLFGCTKHKLEKFNNRIIGNWALVEINTFGVGSSHIVFDGGVFRSTMTTVQSIMIETTIPIRVSGT
ncbi:hypothetical protein [Niabella ginsengisoli]|uniref:Lipocalin-like domain-containing protein n=1 Tax=Niabella ginsengisoli TaxID=522298 RepID=A0ABS9SG15_9BACT|nr:hypothetical protein [Niabella ginsengisoli]MCH5597307.1 hypothetical protein [Niabella ginsengisoli]